MKFLLLLITLITAQIPTTARAAQIVNVDYIAQYSKRVWNIDVPYRAEQKMHAANTEYLLGVVDWLNTKINGKQTTNYGTGPYATHQAADTVATIRAIDTLVRPEYKFFFTPAPDDNTFSFRIGAAGIFAIDWGDGNVQIVNKPTTGTTEISHTFPGPANTYKVSLGGHATGYPITTTSAIAFYDGTETKNASGIKSMSGCLGCVFSTLPDGAQPRFFQTFAYNTDLTGQLYEGLFDGVTGAPSGYMFHSTFIGCTGLTGSIPENLFSSISGEPAQYMFYNTFSGCTGLTGSIPENLFSSITGAPAQYMFHGTFSGCTGLTGQIPENLFAGIQGRPATNMFWGTFNGCTRLTGEIPGNLFAGIEGPPATNMFGYTFCSCRNLSGEIPGNLFAGIEGPPANTMFMYTFFSCDNLTGPIPGGLFAGISGAPAYGMFSGTFRGCTKLTSIPEDLFGDISGPMADSMFWYTFFGATGLAGLSARVGKPGEREFLYERWPDTELRGDVGGESRACYGYDSGLADWANIPVNWGGPKAVE